MKLGEKIRKISLWSSMSAESLDRAIITNNTSVPHGPWTLPKSLFPVSTLLNMCPYNPQFAERKWRQRKYICMPQVTQQGLGREQI